MTIAFNFWTAPQKDPNGFLDADDRQKVAKNVFRFDVTLAGAKLIVREVHKKYSVKRVRDILRSRLRSVLLTTSNWNNDIYRAREFGEARGIIRSEHFPLLGIDPAWARGEQRKFELIRKLVQKGYSYPVAREMVAEQKTAPAAEHEEMVAMMADLTAGMQRERAIHILTARLSASGDFEELNFAELTAKATTEYDARCRRPSVRQRGNLQLVYSRD